MYATVAGLLGLAIGDALGVPVEFKSREFLKVEPVKSMLEWGTHGQVKGTWSDDSVFTFCLVESLIQGYDLQDIADKFVKALDEGYWTPHGELFDIGITTKMAIKNIKRGITPNECGGKWADDNGNGSLMRILPLAFYLKDVENSDEKFKIIEDVSAITHGHIRSKIACAIYVEFAINLLKGYSLRDSYCNMRDTIINHYGSKEPQELKVFSRILNEDIDKLSEKDIKSSGYVVDTLEASLWCLMTTPSYKKAVLKGVNLGEDTDTTGAVVGGLAGIYYNLGGLPNKWVLDLVRDRDIVDLAQRFSESLNTK